MAAHDIKEKASKRGLASIRKIERLIQKQLLLPFHVAPQKRQPQKEGRGHDQINLLHLSLN
jgi:hypothetical protein